MTCYVASATLWQPAGICTVPFELVGLASHGAIGGNGMFTERSCIVKLIQSLNVFLLLASWSSAALAQSTERPLECTFARSCLYYPATPGQGECTEGAEMWVIKGDGAADYGSTMIWILHYRGDRLVDLSSPLDCDENSFRFRVEDRTITANCTKTFSGNPWTRSISIDRFSGDYRQEFRSSERNLVRIGHCSEITRRF